MKEDKKISFEDSKEIQLKMLDEIDEFCRINGIRYSLAFGTLLGAIRHQGFIPWDDDVDIMMPYPDLLRFRNQFRSTNLEYYDVDNNKLHGFAFSRVSKKNTYNKIGIIAKGQGVCIDLLPIIGLPVDNEAYFSKSRVLSKYLTYALLWSMRCVRYFPINTPPLLNYIGKKYRDCLIENSREYDLAKSFYVIATSWERHEFSTFDHDIFKETIRIKFEDREYSAISDWDYFLKTTYGNYMELPPVEQRHPYHSGNYFWR